jgi:hypothetical protein
MPAVPGTVATPKGKQTPLVIFAGGTAAFFALSFLTARGGTPSKWANAFGALIILALAVNSSDEFEIVSKWFEDASEAAVGGVATASSKTTAKAPTNISLADYATLNAGGTAPTAVYGTSTPIDIIGVQPGGLNQGSATTGINPGGTNIAGGTAPTVGTSGGAAPTVVAAGQSIGSGANATAWADAFLTALGAPVNSVNVQSIVDWYNAEDDLTAQGGATDTGENNPLGSTADDGNNVTAGSTGSGNASAVPGTPNNLNYGTPAEGIAGNVATVTNGSYDAILSALKAGTGLLNDSSLSSEFLEFSGEGYDVLPAVTTPGGSYST